MKTTLPTTVLGLALAGFSAPHRLLAQGPLTPPGAPAPTMKTLDQVQPRTPIDAASTPGDAGNLFRITAPGSYDLTAPVTGVTGRNGISIEANDVTIDLRGFTLGGVGGSLDGIHVAAGFARLTVRHGTIAGWGGDGVDEVDGGATDGVFEDVHATQNAGDGLRLGNRVTVRACKVSDNSVFGLTVNGSATITGTNAADNGRSGLLFGAGSALECVVSSNGEAGIECVDEPALITKCVAFGNSGTGLKAPDGAKLAACISRDNIFGIEVGSYSTVTDCTLKNNSTGIFAGGSCRIVRNTCEGNWSAGVRTLGNRNLIDGNQTLNGGTGILTDPSSAHNLIRRNTSGGNSSNNYEIAADNRYGPIVDITPTGEAAVAGSSAADTTGTTHPWANFAY